MFLLISLIKNFPNLRVNQEEKKVVLQDLLVEQDLREQLALNLVGDERALLGAEVKATIEEEEVVAIVEEEAEVKVEEEEADVVIATEAKVDHIVEEQQIQEHILDHLEDEESMKEEANLQFLILLIKDEKMIEFIERDNDRDQIQITEDIADENHVQEVEIEKKLSMFQCISQLLICRIHKK